MQHNKNTKFVMYVDDFLSKETLHSLQETLVNLNYEEVKNPAGQEYGFRHTFPKTGSTTSNNNNLIVQRSFFKHTFICHISPFSY